MIINPYRFAAAGGFDGFGNASRDFDGVNDTGDYVNIGDVLDGVTAGADEQWSTALWIKGVASGVVGSIFGRFVDSASGATAVKSWLVWITTADKVRFSFYGDAAGSTQRRVFEVDTALTTPASTWHQIACMTALKQTQIPV